MFRFHGIEIRKGFYFGQYKEIVTQSQRPETIVSSHQTGITSKANETVPVFGDYGFMVIKFNVFIQNRSQQFTVVGLFFNGMAEEKVFFIGYQL